MNVKKMNILNSIDKIYEHRRSIENDEEKHTAIVNQVRAEVQRMAVEAIENGPDKCIVAMATGSGKSKVAIDYDKKHSDSTALVVPTQKLRDVNWEDEYEKWEKGTSHLDKTCYISANKKEDREYDLCIMDEGHNITEANSSFLLSNDIRKTILLTATVPDSKENKEKKELLDELGFKVVFDLSLDACIKLGFVAPYTINIVEVPLENSKKEIVGGTKKKPFMTTEASTYSWLSNEIKRSYYQPRKSTKFLIMRRMRFIYDLPSKLRAAKYILNNFVDPEKRYLIFSSNIKQAEELCKYTYHSKTDDKDYKAFKEGEINRLSCVKAINEGENFSSLDGAVIVQLTSKEKDLVQRLGRTIRYSYDHKAVIWIIVSSNTVDENWLDKATRNLEPTNINYYNYKNLDKYAKKESSEPGIKGKVK